MQAVAWLNLIGWCINVFVFQIQQYLSAYISKTAIRPKSTFYNNKSCPLPYEREGQIQPSNLEPSVLLQNKKVHWIDSVRLSLCRAHVKLTAFVALKMSDQA